jgi:hypothetical protein
MDGGSEAQSARVYFFMFVPKSLELPGADFSISLFDLDKLSYHSLTLSYRVLVQPVNQLRSASGANRESY